MFLKFIKLLSCFSAFFSILISYSAHADLKNLSFCVDENYWFPYLTADANSGIAGGALIDVAKEIVQRMGKKLGTEINATYNAKPWARCTTPDLLTDDAVITLSYREKRAEFLIYPPSAKEEKKRCTAKDNFVCAKYVFVVPESFTGQYSDKQSLLNLKPIRFPRSYSVGGDLISDLKSLGINEKEFINIIEDGKTDSINLEKTSRDNNGSALVDDTVANYLIKQKKLNLKILETPYQEKSNYIAFSKSTKVTPAEMDLFWNTQAAVLADKKFMDKTFNKYIK